MHRFFRTIKSQIPSAKLYINLKLQYLFEVWILMLGILMSIFSAFQFVRFKLVHHRLYGVSADSGHAIAYYPKHRFIAINTDNSAA